MPVRRWLLCALFFIAPSLWAQWAPNRLKQVVILTRHGVRSPLNTSSDYVSTPWPDIQKDWHVDCCGDLTPAGEELVRLMGVYYHAHYAQAGLLSKQCPAQQVLIWADNEERTILTARELALGLGDGVPGCSVSVKSLAYNPPGCYPPADPKNCLRDKAGPTDLWFHPRPQLGQPDANKLNAVADGINNRYNQLQKDYLASLEALQKALGCCSSNKCQTSPCTLLALPHEASSDGKSVKWDGAFNVGSNASEIFLLEYGNGMPCGTVGWGRVAFKSPDCDGPQSFRLMQEIHTAYFEEMQRNPYLAQIQGSNITNQILRRLRPTTKANIVAPRLVIFSGHDTNIANVAGLLNLSWELRDLPKNDTPPAGALIFELYTGSQPGDYYVKVHYVHQTLQQLRKQAPLSTEHGPDWSEVLVPGCQKNLKKNCTFKQFEKIVQSAIDPNFVSPNPTQD